MFLCSKALIRVLPAGREAEGKPRLWATLHQIAGVGRSTGTVSTRVSLTLIERKTLKLHLHTYATGTDTHIHPVLCRIALIGHFSDILKQKRTKSEDLRTYVVSACVLMIDEIIDFFVFFWLMYLV